MPCSRCGVQLGDARAGELCDLCSRDRKLGRAIEQWARREGTRDLLTRGGESLTPVLEYDLFRLVLKQLAPLGGHDEGGR